MRKPLLPAALLSASLAGCSGSIAGIASAPLICESWQPISISKDDKLTDRTIREIAGNNAANEQFCGKRPVEREPQRVASKSTS